MSGGPARRESLGRPAPVLEGTRARAGGTVSLRIYNTLTRQKEPFAPLVPGQVGMYVCGITPYDVSHIGHARSALVFDVVAPLPRLPRATG